MNSSPNIILLLSTQKMYQKMYYFGYDFSDCCSHLYCGELKHRVSAVIFPRVVSLVYLGTQMIQSGKSFFKFDCLSISKIEKMISHFDSFLCLDKQGTHVVGRRIQRVSIPLNKVRKITAKIIRIKPNHKNLVRYERMVQGKEDTCSWAAGKWSRCKSNRNFQGNT